MTNERLTFEEMKQHFPDEWLLIVDCEFSDNAELLAGRVAVHSKNREDIYAVSGNYSGGRATRYTGKMPEGVGYLL